MSFRQPSGSRNFEISSYSLTTGQGSGIQLAIVIATDEKFNHLMHIRKREVCTIANLIKEPL